MSSDLPVAKEIHLIRHQLWLRSPFVERDLDTHYYPFLKGRDGEFRALEQLSVEQRDPITPLIDAPPQKVTFERDGEVKRIQIETVDEALDGYAAKLVKAWGQVDPCLIDLAGFDPADRLEGGAHPLATFLAEAREVGLSAVPVTGPDRDLAQIQTVREVTHGRPLGAAIRLRGPTLAQPSKLGAALFELLGRIHKEAHEVDLLIDFGALIKSSFAETAATAKQVIAAVPQVDRWRSLVVCSGSYPTELGNFVGKHETRELPRRDWQLWRTLTSSGSDLPRLPAFGDYAIARADWLSAFDPTEMSISAKIVYTSEEDWVVVKGERLTTDPLQFHDLARRLRYHPSFLAEGHCPSEAKIIRCANNVGGPGNLRVWMTVGTRHHIEVVTQQLASLA